MNRSTTRKNQWKSLLFLPLIIAFSLSLAMPARADTMWTLNNVTFTDNGIASGYFDLNLAGVVTAVGITTTAGTGLVFAGFGNILPGMTYNVVNSLTQYLPAGGGVLGFNCGFSGSCIQFEQGGTAGGPYALDFYIAAAALPEVTPTSALGNEPLLVYPTVLPFGSSESQTSTGAFREVDPGSLTGTYIPGTPYTGEPTTGVPEPGTLALFGVGLAALVLGGRRKGLLVIS